MADQGIPTREKLKKLKVTTLRQRLSKLSLPQGGLKDDLITRLLEHYQATHQDESDPQDQPMEQDGTDEEDELVKTTPGPEEQPQDMDSEVQPQEVDREALPQEAVTEQATGERGRDQKYSNEGEVKAPPSVEDKPRPLMEIKLEETTSDYYSASDAKEEEVSMTTENKASDYSSTSDAKEEVSMTTENKASDHSSTSDAKEEVSMTTENKASYHSSTSDAKEEVSMTTENKVLDHSSTSDAIKAQEEMEVSMTTESHADSNINASVTADTTKEGKRKKKKKRRRRRHDQPQVKSHTTKSKDTSRKDRVEVEYIQEDILRPDDPYFRTFFRVFENFRIQEPEDKKPEMPSVSDLVARAAMESKRLAAQRQEDSDEEEEGEKEQPKISKKKLRRMNRLSVAQLKQLVERPDVVEMHDVTAPDPQLLIHLKSTRNTVPVPRHWCYKRKYLQGKRGIEKPPFDLPDFIKATGVMEMRQALEEKEDAKSLKQKTRERVRPKMGKLTIDYQKLHDAFFKWQTKPKMTIHGDLYYEGKEFETRLRQKKPGDLSDELRRALGMPTGLGRHRFPPPWLVAMQRYGPPPSYPNLKIPGLNSPIPEGCSFGYFVGGWGKPPVDERGRPLYGDVFGLEGGESTTKGARDDEEVDQTLWGELESEEEESSEEEEEEEEQSPKAEDIQAGLVTPVEGLATPSGLTSIPAGLETPEMIQLRKKKIEEAMEQGGETPALYTVLPEKTASVGGAMMGSSHVYDMASAVPGALTKASGSTHEGIEVALDPSELDLDTATMSARYEEQLREQQGQLQKEDLSDMVAEHAAKQKKRKRPAGDSGGKATKKLKEFKF